jgi:hypothetical protein
MSAGGLEPSTVKAIYRTFGQIMKMAEIDRLIERSPCVGILRWNPCWRSPS